MEKVKVRNKLFIVTTEGCGQFYVVASSFGDAADRVTEELEKIKYGYSVDRRIKSVSFLKEESVYHDRRYFGGDNNVNNLIL